MFFFFDQVLMVKRAKNFTTDGWGSYDKKTEHGPKVQSTVAPKSNYASYGG
jgi:hypothetical protein